jgi:hypothetical protein
MNLKNIIVDLVMRFRPKVKIQQYVLVNQFQPWLETILLVNDKEVERLSGWTIGYYHCSHCHTYQGFTFQLPPVGGDPVSAQAHNDRNMFWRAHAHGDGRIHLFEVDLPVLQAPTHAMINIYLEHAIGGRLVHTTPLLQIGKGSNPTITFGVIVTLDEFNRVMTGSGV